MNWLEQEIDKKAEKHPYTPTAGANFLDNFCAFPNPSTVPPASNTIKDNVVNHKPKEVKMSNSSAENENLKKKVREMEKGLAKSQEQLKQLHSKNDELYNMIIEYSNDAELKKQSVEWSQKHNETVSNYDLEFHCNNYECKIDSTEKLQKKAQELEENLAQSQEQLEQLKFENDRLWKKVGEYNAELHSIQLAELPQRCSETFANLYSELELLEQDFKTLQDAELKNVWPELVQIYHDDEVDQTSPEAMPNPTDNSALVFDHPSDMNEEMNPYKCSLCSYTGTQLGNLKRHMHFHTGEKPHKCNQCSYACALANSLAIHMRTHTAEKPYKCSQCSYACAQLGSLKMHMRTHTGEKPYKCSQCSYSCTQPCDLKKHIRIHTGEKPYKCDRCSYACAQSSALKLHMRTHSGEKPYNIKQEKKLAATPQSTSMAKSGNFLKPQIPEESIFVGETDANRFRSPRGSDSYITKSEYRLEKNNKRRIAENGTEDPEISDNPSYDENNENDDENDEPLDWNYRGFEIF